MSKTPSTDCISEKDRSYLETYYQSHGLYESDGWLDRADDIVLTYASKLPPHARIIDIGSGSGRNAIAVAALNKQHGVHIDCVEPIRTAARQLEVNASNFRVRENISIAECPIADFQLAADTYDLVIGWSCFEYSYTAQQLAHELRRIKAATAAGGCNIVMVHCDITLGIATNGSFRAAEHGRPCRFTSSGFRSFAEELYRDWSLERMYETPYEETIHLDDGVQKWTSTEIAFAARKPARVAEGEYDAHSK